MFSGTTTYVLKSELHDGDPHLFIDILQQGSPSVLRLLAVLALLLQGVGVSEVGLGVDVVEAWLRHHQLPVHQLDILEEGQALLPFPPRDLLALNSTSSRDWSYGKRTYSQFNLINQCCDATFQSD